MTLQTDLRGTKVPLRRRTQLTHTGRMTRVFVIVVALLSVFAGSAAARGTDQGGDGNDVRVAGVCGRGATASLRVRSRDAGIEVRFQLRQTRGRGTWRVTIVHENRVAARAIVKTTRGDDSYEVRRTLRDLPGSDTIVVHAWGPSGLSCRAAAALLDSSAS